MRLCLVLPCSVSVLLRLSPYTRLSFCPCSCLSLVSILDLFHVSVCSYSSWNSEFMILVYHQQYISLLLFSVSPFIQLPLPCSHSFPSPLHLLFLFLFPSFSIPINLLSPLILSFPFILPTSSSSPLSFFYPISIPSHLLNLVTQFLFNSFSPSIPLDLPFYLYLSLPLQSVSSFPMAAPH